VRGVLLLVAVCSGTPARASEPACTSDAQCDLHAICDWKLGCVPRQVRRTPRPPPQPTLLIVSPVEKARERRVIGTGLSIAGVVIGAVGTGLLAAAYANNRAALSSPIELGGLTAAAIGGSLAAPGFALRAIGVHDARFVGDHAAAHARKRWRVGAGLLAAGAVLAVGSLGLMAAPGAVYTTPSLFAVGGMLVTTGMPLLIAGGRDGGAPAPGTLVSF
jgi:hypothetical protein